MIVALIAWPPLAFLLVIAGASALAVRRGARSAEQAGDAVRDHVPVLLAVTLGVVGATLIALVIVDADSHRQLAAALGTGAWLRDLALGAAAGALIAGLYFGGLDRIVELAQRRFGDFVPPGSTSVLGSQRVAFFVANVVLAPVVEELWYRGLLYADLGAEVGVVAAAVIGCVAFGVFHWPGGAWYMLVTGSLVGGVCWLLRAQTDALLAPYGAHLALNAIEYVVLVRRARRTPV